MLREPNFNVEKSTLPHSHSGKPALAHRGRRHITSKIAKWTTRQVCDARLRGQVLRIQLPRDTLGGYNDSKFRSS
jgi:hypothetical protein